MSNCLFESMADGTMTLSEARDLDGTIYKRSGSRWYAGLIVKTEYNTATGAIAFVLQGYDGNTHWDNLVDTYCFVGGKLYRVVGYAPESYVGKVYRRRVDGVKHLVTAQSDAAVSVAPVGWVLFDSFLREYEHVG